MFGNEREKFRLQLSVSREKFRKEKKPDIQVGEMSDGNISGFSRDGLKSGGVGGAA